MEQKAEILNMLDHLKIVNAPNEASIEDFKWNCSPDLRAILQSMGLYETMREQMFVISTSKSKRDIDVAKAKLDALSKQMMICKAAITVNKDSGSEDTADGITSIKIKMEK